MFTDDRLWSLIWSILFAVLTALGLGAGCKHQTVQFAGDLMQEVNAAGWTADLELSGPTKLHGELSTRASLGSDGHFAARLRTPSWNAAYPAERPSYPSPSEEIGPDG